MKLLFVLGLAGGLLGLIRAQVAGVNLSGLPQCAQNCLENNTNSDGGCAITDIHCLCSSISYINALSCCLQQTCSPAEQRSALAFDIGLCNTVNVSIPDFLGCSPLSSSITYHFSSASASSTPSQLQLQSTTATTAPAFSTASLTESPFTTTSGGPVAQFTGNLLLRGQCSVPHIASYSMSGGGFLQYPWVGCATELPDCCPFNIAQAGPLTICPSDYATIGTACCPSGWLVYTSAIASQTPCYTSPALPLVAPSMTLSSNAGMIRVISTELFTLRYDLAPLAPSSSNAGVKAGAAVGAVGGVMLLFAAGFYARRSRQRRSRANANLPGSHIDAELEGKDAPGLQGEAALVPAPLSPNHRASELMSDQGHWSPDVLSIRTPLSRNESFPTELPASTFIDEHHPAYRPIETQFGPTLSTEQVSPRSPGTPSNTV